MAGVVPLFRAPSGLRAASLGPDSPLGTFCFDCFPRDLKPQQGLNQQLLAALRQPHRVPRNAARDSPCDAGSSRRPRQPGRRLLVPVYRRTRAEVERAPGFRLVAAEGQGRDLNPSSMASAPLMYPCGLRARPRISPALPVSNRKEGWWPAVPRALPFPSTLESGQRGPSLQASAGHPASGCRARGAGRRGRAVLPLLHLAASALAEFLLRPGVAMSSPAGHRPGGDRASLKEQRRGLLGGRTRLPRGYPPRPHDSRAHLICPEAAAAAFGALGEARPGVQGVSGH